MAYNYEGDLKQIKTFSNEQLAVRHGHGVYTSHHGLYRYEGEYQDGVKHGYGEFRVRDYSVYQGDFVNGQMEGNGIMTWLKTRHQYEGEFKQGLMHGRGVYSVLDEDGEHLSERYDGSWENGERSGEGELTYSNGDHYAGTFKNHLMNGSGIYSWEDGACYEGNFEQGKRSGEGVEILANGENYNGYFENDRKHGQGQYESEHILYNGLWDNGVPIMAPTKIQLRIPKIEKIVEEEKKRSNKKSSSDSSETAKTPSRKLRNVSIVPVVPIEADEHIITDIKSCQLPEHLQKSSSATTTDNDSIITPESPVIIIDIENDTVCEVPSANKLKPLYICVCDEKGNIVHNETGRLLRIKIMPAELETIKGAKKSKKRGKDRSKNNYNLNNSLSNTSNTSLVQSLSTMSLNDDQETEPPLFFCSCKALNEKFPLTVEQDEDETTTEQQQLTSPTKVTSEKSLKINQKHNKKQESKTKAAKISQKEKEAQAAIVSNELALLGSRCTGRCSILLDDEIPRCIEIFKMVNEPIICIDELIIASDVEIGTIFKLEVEDVTFPYSYNHCIPHKIHPTNLVPTDPLYLFKYTASTIHPAVFQPQFINNETIILSRDSIPLRHVESPLFRPLKPNSVIFRVVPDAAIKAKGHTKKKK